jgi:hypothetical protein
MSHFTVLIFGENPEAQLTPFDENISVERYIRYTKKELIEKERKDIEYYKNSMYAEYLKDPVAYAEVSNEEHMQYISEEFPKRLEWSDDEAYAYAIEGYYDKEDIGEDGEVYSTYNPNSKWDWYSLGGRWSGEFKLKQGRAGVCGNPGRGESSPKWGYADQALKGDIDFDLMTSEKLKKYTENYNAFEAKLIEDPEMKTFNAYFEFGIENKGDKKNFIPETLEEYLNSRVEFSTFAVIKYGKWYERGEMGWWGPVLEEKESSVWNDEFKKLIDSVPDDTLLSMYDCHI